MTKRPPAPLLDVGDLRITAESMTTADDEYSLSSVSTFESTLTKPFLVPLVLAVLGTINAVVAVQTMFWGDFLACAVMLGGGAWWRSQGTRHVLSLTLDGTSKSVWRTRDAQSMGRVVTCLEQLGKRRKS